MSSGPPARPWITDSVLTELGDLEIEATYPDGMVKWITVPGELAGSVDLIALAEAARSRPPVPLPPGGG